VAGSFEGDPVAVGPPLDLAALLAEAEAGNPDILAMGARLDAAEHVPSQMEARPDPTVWVGYTNEELDDFTLGETPDSVLMVSWTQEVPYPGKRRLAGDVARSEVEVVRQRSELVVLRVRAEVKKGYSELVRLDHQRMILEESRKLLESFLETARRRYESGEGILENVLKAQTELTRLDAQLAILARERRSAEIALNSLLGRAADGPLGPALAPPRAQSPDLASLEQAALDRSPGLASARAAVAREEVRVDLAKKDLKPDLMWTAAYGYRDDLEPMITGAVGFKLPLYRRKKQAEAVAQTQYELQVAQRDVSGVEVRTLAEVRDLVARAESARLQMRLYSEGLLPQARSALDAAAGSYAVGKTEFVTLIDDFLALLEFEHEYEDQRAVEAEALAALEPVTGISLLEPAGASAPGEESHE
jgi:outer membrane protein TolC